MHVAIKSRECTSKKNNNNNWKKTAQRLWKKYYINSCNLGQQDHRLVPKVYDIIQQYFHLWRKKKSLFWIKHPFGFLDFYCESHVEVKRSRASDQRKAYRGNHRVSPLLFMLFYCQLNDLNCVQLSRAGKKHPCSQLSEFFYVLALEHVFN